MKRGIAALLTALLALSLGQEAELRFHYDAYIYLALDVDEVVFDFSQEAGEEAGLLSQLDPETYPTYAMPPASAGGWIQCFESADAPTGTYEGTTIATSGEDAICRFAPTQIVKNDAFEAHYLRTGRTSCDGPLYADGSVLVLSNTDWKVQARIGDTLPPNGIKLHILPLTYQDPQTLCAKRRLSDERVKRKDRTLSTSRTTLSTDPSSRTSRAFYTQYQGVYLVPMLFYLELDLGELDPALLDNEYTIEVEYLVRAR